MYGLRGNVLIESAEVLNEVIGRSLETPERSLAPFGIENCYLRIEFVLQSPCSIGVACRL
jgi:hypothetical protein